MVVPETAEIMHLLEDAGIGVRAFSIPQETGTFVKGLCCSDDFWAVLGTQFPFPTNTFVGFTLWLLGQIFGA